MIVLELFGKIASVDAHVYKNIGTHKNDAVIKNACADFMLKKPQP